STQLTRSCLKSAMTLQTTLHHPSKCQVASQCRRACGSSCQRASHGTALPQCLPPTSARATYTQQAFSRCLIRTIRQAAWYFHGTADRRSANPSQGVACFDCHTNGHTNGADHLVGDIHPQEFRHRIETPSLRGVNIQRLFGSQRALKSVEDFTEFEQRAAYFDGDPVTAQKKGVNILERGSQVHFMAEFQELLDFPPAPKL